MAIHITHLSMFRFEIHLNFLSNRYEYCYPFCTLLLRIMTMCIAPLTRTFGNIFRIKRRRNKGKTPSIEVIFKEYFFSRVFIRNISFMHITWCLFYLASLKQVSGFGLANSVLFLINSDKHSDLNHTLD